MTGALLVGLHDQRVSPDWIRLRVVPRLLMLCVVLLAVWLLHKVPANPHVNAVVDFTIFRGHVHLQKTRAGKH